MVNKFIKMCMEVNRLPVKCFWVTLCGFAVRSPFCLLKLQ